jgi:hypothetical protein
MQVCPQCGYSEIPIPTSVSFSATEYTHEKTGKKSVIASNKESIDAKDGKWVRSDLYKPAAPIKPVVVEVKK